MHETLQQSIEQHLKGTELSNLRVVGFDYASGGCINQAGVVFLENGQRLFVKWNDSAPQAMFAAEAEGLKKLRETNSIRVPNVIGRGSCGETNFLLLEELKLGEPGSDFFELFGRQLAIMHQWTDGRTDFGFSSDNFIGSTTQPNGGNCTTENWPKFWAEFRLGHQLRLAAVNGRANSELNRLGRKLLSRTEGLLAGPNEHPSVLHGDLWSGNFLADENGQPAIFDPACYFGNREAEFGMITLFGGFDQPFSEAYNEVWPLADGSQQRIELYRLYHLLNHLNLFGPSYMHDCLTIMRKYC